jgi:hypothetical protein
LYASNPESISKETLISAITTISDFSKKTRSALSSQEEVSSVKAISTELINTLPKLNDEQEAKAREKQKSLTHRSNQSSVEKDFWDKDLRVYQTKTKFEMRATDIFNILDKERPVYNIASIGGGKTFVMEIQLQVVVSKMEIILDSMVSL